LPSPAARMTAVTWLIGYQSFYPGPPESQSGFTPKSASGPPLSAVAKMQQKAFDPRRNRRSAFDHLPESRMDKRESGRVECIAVERDRRARTGLSIYRVADDRVPQRRQMDANLVGTPGLEANLQQREVGKALEHAIAGDG